MRAILSSMLLTVAFQQVLLGQEPQWSIEGRTIGMDNCAVVCPCIFGEQPTHGKCQGLFIMVIDKGTYGDVSLANTSFAIGSSYSGQSEMAQQSNFVAYYIDANANAAQKEALKKIAASKFFEMFGKPMEIKETPIKLNGMENFGQAGKTCQATVGDIARVQITPISGGIKDKPLVVENSAEPLFYWTALGESSDSYYKSADFDWKFNGTSGESHKFSIKSTDK